MRQKTHPQPDGQDKPNGFRQLIPAETQPVEHSHILARIEK
jgi:hypothetical protein